MRENPTSEYGACIVVPKFQPGEFFDATQLERLGQLMERLHQARGAGRELEASEQAELEALIDAEFDASARRAEAMAKQFKSRSDDVPPVQ